MAWIKYTGRTQLPGIPDSGEPTMSDRPEIPLAPLADLQRRVEALEQVMVPLCEQTQELIREVLEMIHDIRKERS